MLRCEIYQKSIDELISRGLYHNLVLNHLTAQLKNTRSPKHRLNHAQKYDLCLCISQKLAPVAVAQKGLSGLFGNSQQLIHYLTVNLEVGCSFPSPTDRRLLSNKSLSQQNRSHLLFKSPKNGLTSMG